MYMGITLVILMDMYNHLAEKDKPYFRESREKLFGGQKLEAVRNCSTSLVLPLVTSLQC